MSTDHSPHPYTRARPNFKDQLLDIYHNFGSYATGYFKSLFPIIHWIGRYNLTWLAGDVIAGLTAGSVVIPQGMGYAKIVGLGAEYGLYTSFVGVSIYALFATTKDITIGPTAVMSLLMSQHIKHIQEHGSNVSIPDLATAFAFYSGIFTTFLGLIRLGIVVDFISGPVIAGFTTGSALTVACSQLPKLFGIKGIDNRESAYLVFGNTLKNLGGTQIDAVMGLVTLLVLYILKFGTQYGENHSVRFKRVWFFIGILRNIGVMILTTFISWMITKGQKTPSISILKNVPSGFQHVAAPPTDTNVISEMIPYLPTTILILILEHVALAKSFGRLNNYKINPSQELIAIGVTNTLGAFFGAYPATGSFSRSALKSKSGVRTPLAGIFSGILVVLALYLLTGAFYFISDAALSAVIIHAVLDLLSTPQYVKLLWKVNFWDFSVFVVATVFTIFFNVEIGIYTSTGLSLLVLLVRIARPRFDALGRLALDTVRNATAPNYAYVPLDHPSFTAVENPPDGIIIFRFEESLTYPNASYVDEQIVAYVKQHTRRLFVYAEKKGDRPWNDSGTRGKEEEARNEKLPALRAIVFDFGAVSIVDSTGVQSLIDIRKELNKHANRPIEYHFANLLEVGVQETLIIGGFGTFEDGHDNLTFPNTDTRALDHNEVRDSEKPIDEENQKPKQKKLFHLSLEAAVAAAIDAEW